MEEQNRSFKNPLKLIVNTAIFIFVLLFLAYVGLKVGSGYEADTKRAEMLQGIALDIKKIVMYVFDFVQPFLQLVLILIILEWLLSKFGLSLNRNSLKFEWNIQTAIAMVVIVAFSLAALSGVTGASDLKDIALVVVGFYFGS